MNPVFVMKGEGETLEVFEDKIIITPKGVVGFLNKGLKGAKTIPISSITALQFKESGLTHGYIQFSIHGGVESRGGVFAAHSDENTFNFFGTGLFVPFINHKEVNALAQRICEFIETRMRALKRSSSGSDLSEQLQKLAQMKQDGDLTESEFAAAKKRLLG